jgi:serine/threonine-protein kinase
MSPEQASGRRGAVTTSSDIYSLGAVLYELLTGRPPFRADSLMETLHEVIEREPVRPRSANPGIPAPLEAICLKCLSKDPRDRYATAGALADDLEAFDRGDPVIAQLGSTNRLLRLLLRETRHAEVMVLWGRVWTWHAAEVLALFWARGGLLWAGVRSPWAVIAVWSVGLISIAAVIWHFRFRNGPRLTPLEWQIGQVWSMFGAGFVLTGIVNHLMGRSILQVLPFVLLEAGLGFGCMAAILGGSFYLTGLICVAMSLILAAFDQSTALSLAFGVLFAIGLIVPAWTYSRGEPAPAPLTEEDRGMARR